MSRKIDVLFHGQESFLTILMKCDYAYNVQFFQQIDCICIIFNNYNSWIICLITNVI